MVLFNRSIDQLRTEVGKDFDQAVAVSEDGKRIVCADQVFILGELGWSRYRPDAFLGAKIYLTESSTTYALTLASDELEMPIFTNTPVHRRSFQLMGQYIDPVVQCDTPPLVQVLVATRDGQRWFLTTKNYAPDSLPGGDALVQT